MNCVMRTRLIGHLCVLSLQDDWGPICGGSGRRYRQRVSQIPSTQPRRNCLRERTSIGALEPVAKDILCNRRSLVARARFELPTFGF